MVIVHDHSAYKVMYAVCDERFVFLPTLGSIKIAKRTMENWVVLWVLSMTRHIYFYIHYAASSCMYKTIYRVMWTSKVARFVICYSANVFRWVEIMLCHPSSYYSKCQPPFFRCLFVLDYVGQQTTISKIEFLFVWQSRKCRQAKWEFQVNLINIVYFDFYCYATSEISTTEKTIAVFVKFQHIGQHEPRSARGLTVSKIVCDELTNAAPCIYLMFALCRSLMFISHTHYSCFILVSEIAGTTVNFLIEYRMALSCFLLAYLLLHAMFAVLRNVNSRSNTTERHARHH